MLRVLISALFILHVGGIQVNFLENELPNNIPIVSVIYDGQDSIYIWGKAPWGFNAPCYIYKSTFTLENGLLSDLEFVAEIPDCSSTATGQSDSNGNLFFFGLKNQDDSEVLKLDSETKNITEIKLPSYYSMYGKTTIRLGNKVLILGDPRREKGSFVFNMETGEVSSEFSHPFKKSAPTASLNCGNKGAIFGVVDGQDSLFILDTVTMEYTKAPVDFQYFFRKQSAACDGKYLYLMGGYDKQTYCSPDTAGIIRMDLNTFDWELLGFEEFEKASFDFTRVPASVFVDKLNRIYFFDGDIAFNNGFPDTGKNPYNFRRAVWYLELNDLKEIPLKHQAETFSCCVNNNGIYPNPNSCSSFLNCEYEKRTKLKCPNGLIFDNKTRNCNLPEFTECPTHFCKDRANGTYPDEYDGKDFIICKNGETTEFSCPDDLHFSQEKLHCVLKKLS